MTSVLRLVAVCLSALLSSVALSQTTVGWRGAWVADIDDVRHILYLVLADDKLSGFYCAACNDPANLAFIDDGSITADKLDFTLYRTDAGGAETAAKAELKLFDAAVLLTLGDGEAMVSLRREPAPPPAAAPAPRPPAPPRSLPASAELLTVDNVAGLWLSGSGPNKQYFIFKRHKDGLRGMVCGPCSRAQAFAPLENVRLDGTVVHFDIVHEDNGFGFVEHGPFRNLTQARIAMNEMQLSTVASYEPDATPFEMTLLGPVQFMPPHND
jgi:hypothetical protein